MVGTGYVEGLYGRRTPDQQTLARMEAAGGEAGGDILRAGGPAKWKRALLARIKALVGERS